MICPICRGHGVQFGFLGLRKHFRCRQCGIDFSTQEENPEEKSDQDGPDPVLD